MNERAVNERSVFAAALDLGDPAAMAKYLDEACAGDPALRARVEALLTSHRDAGAFMARPALEALLASSSSPAAVQESGGGESRASSTGTTPSDRPGRDADEPTLDFLEPPSRPGLLGRLGHYDVLEVIGRGGFGIVLKAFDTRLQRVVAIKVLAGAVAASSTARMRFLREARAAAAVRNEHVVGIYHVDEQPVPYLVMECIAGQTLQDKLERGGPLALTEVLRIGHQVARGLAAAHEQGLVHRDIKPANILLENSVERVKITDFGLAMVTDEARVTQSGVVAGTPLYMAPEQAEGQTVDHRADLFSLGSVLYALCTGRPPFEASTSLAIMKRVCEETPPPLRELKPEVPERLGALIATLHAKRREERIQSAKDVADALGGILAELQRPGGDFLRHAVAFPAAVRGPAANRGRAGRTSAPWRRVVGLATGVGVVLLAVVVGVVVKRQPEELPAPSVPLELPTKPAGPDEPENPPRAVVPFDAKQARAFQQAWASHLGIQVEFTNKIGMKLCLIPPGAFLMGSNFAEVKPEIDRVMAKMPTGYQNTARSLKNETPQHLVRISRPFAMGATEVTVGQFRQFVEAAQYTSTLEQAGGWGAREGALVKSAEFNWRTCGGDSVPVWNVSWEDCREFCK